MIKGFALSITIAIFLTSFIFSISSLTGNLKPNLITGAVVGTNTFASYSIVAMILSFVIGLCILVISRKISY